MGDVFLLGAGFSKAVADEMPLLRELSDEVRSAGLDLSPLHLGLSSNIEIWLSYLSQRHPWLREQENLRNQALALDIAQKIENALTKREQSAIQRDIPDWLAKLTQHWHQTRASVFTLNYDTLVERAAHDFTSVEQLYPVTLTLASRRNAAIVSSGEIDSFKLFKLHGSVNWYYSGASEFTGEIIYYGNISGWRSDSFYGEQAESAVNDKVPLIVPPTIEKVRFFEHESLKGIWTQAVARVRNATRLYVIGYSLPPSDLAIRLFLLEGGLTCATRKELYVVNLDDTVGTHYCNLLGGAFEINDRYAGHDAVERFVDGVCTEVGRDG